MHIYHELLSSFGQPSHQTEISPSCNFQTTPRHQCGAIAGTAKHARHVPSMQQRGTPEVKAQELLIAEPSSTPELLEPTLGPHRLSFGDELVRNLQGPPQGRFTNGKQHTVNVVLAPTDSEHKRMRPLPTAVSALAPVSAPVFPSTPRAPPAPHPNPCYEASLGKSSGTTCSGVLKAYWRLSKWLHR